MLTFSTLIRPRVQAELDAASVAEARGQFDFRRMPVPEDLRQVIDGARGAARMRRGLGLALASTAALMTAALVAGCGTVPADLDVSLDRPSSAGVYRVTLVPPQPAPAINQMHSWQVKLAAPDGAPVHGARFAVDGGMPQHGHGLPTQPRVTREIADGTYALEGMKFSMTGWWEVKLAIQGPLGADKVTFNTVVANPAVRPSNGPSHGAPPPARSPPRPLPCRRSPRTAPTGRRCATAGRPATWPPSRRCNGRPPASAASIARTPTKRAPTPRRSAGCCSTTRG